MSVKHNLEQWVAQLDYDDTCDITDRQVSDFIRNYAALEQKLAESQREFRAADATIENLQMQAEKLAAENAGLKSAIPQQRNVEFDNNSMDDVSLAEDFGFNDAIGRMKINMSNTPATDAFLAEVRAQGVEMFAAYCGEENSVFVEAKAYYRSLPDAAYEFASQLRKGVQS